MVFVVFNYFIVFLDCMWDYKREIKGVGISNVIGFVEWIGIVIWVFLMKIIVVYIY